MSNVGQYYLNYKMTTVLFKYRGLIHLLIVIKFKDNLNRMCDVKSVYVITNGYCIFEILVISTHEQ